MAYPVRTLCEVLGLSESTYYYCSQADEEQELREAVEVIAVEYPRYGSRRLTAELRRRGWDINRKHIQRLMREENLLVQVRRYCHTTMSRHPYNRFPNLVKQLEIVRPDQVWCADLTYIRLPKQFGFLAVIMDIFTRSIRGWELTSNMLEDLPKAALLRALQEHRPEIHHSDQGVQYAATGYVALLHSVEAQVSMAARGRPTENAYAERLMRTLKEEEVSLHDYEDLSDARAHIARFLDEVYMTKRVHSALAYVPPAEFEAQWKAKHSET
ncbi:transposase [Ktedonospora formicarum]|uniref:Transposase n=1 Tax=Ktedonospora formicarum TaxID=2778364 RepID=A0A8J3MY27_9CHLR|nr:transposase [Ktedonospora formicarum]